MCGIAGFVSTRSAPQDERSHHLRSMLATIRHRGPDEFGIYLDPHAALGSARLSIIDLSSGQQPISNEDASLWIVFNGEIFNYIELRQPLERAGHRFSTHSDTEVLLHLYQQHGPACLDLLNGQFAFAIWDAHRRRLFAARDRLGVRPLFFTEAGGSFLFASEVKALLAVPGVAAEIDPAAVAEVLTYWSPLAGRTAFKNIQQLQPGHSLTWQDGRLEIRRYWDLRFPPAAETSSLPSPARQNELFEEFSQLLIDSTLVRLRADVAVGAYLSGGLDSSTLTRIITSHTSNRLATFSVTFDDPDYDESDFQRRVSAALGTRHEVVHATHESIAASFPGVVWHSETPLTRTAPVPLYLLSRLVRDSGFKVVVTGEGADEFFAGYDIFKENQVRRFWARHPESAARPALLSRLYADIPGLAATNPAMLQAFFGRDLAATGDPFYSHLIRWRNNARNLRFLATPSATAAPPPLPTAFSSWGALQQSQYLESSVFLSQYLLAAQGDRVAMAHSVEGRHPFLDVRLVEFAARLPSRLKLRGLRDKFILRRFGAAYLPPEISSRPKRPYRAPIHKTFSSRAARPYIDDVLSERSIASAGLFRPQSVSQLLSRLAAQHHLGETDDMALAAILSTQLLHRQFVQSFPSIQPVPVDAPNLKTCAPAFARSL